MTKLAINGADKTVTIPHVKWPQVTQRDKDFVMHAMDEGVFWGPYAPQVTALENEWAEFVGTKYCLSCNSGTAALNMALMAAGVGPEMKSSHHRSTSLRALWRWCNATQYPYSLM